MTASHETRVGTASRRVVPAASLGVAVALAVPLGFLIRESADWPVPIKSKSRADPSAGAAPSLPTAVAPSAADITVLHPPADALVTGSEVTVVWSDPPVSPAEAARIVLVRWIAGRESATRAEVPAVAGPAWSAALRELDPDTEFEYRFRFADGRLSPVRRFRTGPGVRFSQRVYRFPLEVRPGEPSSYPLEVRTGAGKPQFVRVSTRSADPRVAAGIIGPGDPAGAAFIPVGSEIWTLHLSVDASRAPRAVHRLVLDLHQSDAPDEPGTLVDRAVVELRPQPALEPVLPSVEAVSREPGTGALRLRLASRGPAHAAVTLAPSAGLAGRVRFNPEIRDFPLAPAAVIETVVTPVLFAGEPPPRGELVLSAGGSSTVVAVEFPAPDGSRLFPVDEPPTAVARLRTRRPLGPAEVFEVDGPPADADRLDAPPDHSAVGASPPTGRRSVASAATVHAFASPEAALALPPAGIVAPAVAAADPTPQRTPALADRMLERARRHAGFTGAVPTSIHRHAEPDARIAMWVQPEFACVAAVEPGRPLVFATIAAGMVFRPPLNLAPAGARDPVCVRFDRAGMVVGWLHGQADAPAFSLRTSTDLGTSWSDPVDPFAGRLVRDPRLAASGNLILAAALDSRTSHALVRVLDASESASVEPKTEPTDLGPATALAVAAPAPDRFLAVLERERRLLAIELDRRGSTVAAPVDLGPGRSPALLAAPDGSLQLFHLDADSALVRRIRADRTWSDAKNLSADLPVAGPPVAAVRFDTPGAVFPVGPVALEPHWTADAVPVRIRRAPPRVQSAELVLDFVDPWPADRRQPADISIFVNNIDAGTLRAVAGTGRRRLPLNPQVLAAPGSRHTVELRCANLNPGRRLTLVGIDLVTVGPRSGLRWAVGQVQAQASVREGILANPVDSPVLGPSPAVPWTSFAPVRITLAVGSANATPTRPRPLFARRGQRVPLPDTVGDVRLVALPVNLRGLPQWSIAVDPKAADPKAPDPKTSPNPGPQAADSEFSVHWFDTRGQPARLDLAAGEQLIIRVQRTRPGARAELVVP